MDDLRSALEAATEEHSQPEVVDTPEVVEAPSTEAPAVDSPAVELAVESEGGESNSQPSRDKPKSITEVVSETPEAERKESDPRIDRAPRSWKGDSKKVWDQLPLNVRQEVTRRETEISRGLNETALERKQLNEVKGTLAPHMERIQNMYGGNPVHAINNLLHIEQKLFTGSTQDKAQIVANMISRFGIDVSTLDNILSNTLNPSPEAKQQSEIDRLLEQRLAPFNQFMQQQQMSKQQQLQQESAKAAESIVAMEDDPNFPYFNEVRDDMADIIEINSKRGVSISLSEAYNKAVRMNDGTMGSLQAREQSQSATHTALAAHQAAQRAKGAALSVSGNPTGSGASANDSADLRGTIAGLMSSGGRL